MSGVRGSTDRDEVPCVHVRCLGEGTPAWAEYVEHGLEEDGVAWLVDAGFEGDPVAVAYAAALDSALKIGVCVDDSRIVVHQKQLPETDPVFDVTDVTPERARALGSNAARLAKGTPLKPVD